MRVPADSILISGHAQVNAAELTGESEEQERQPVNSFNAPHGACGVLLARSIVMQGYGEAVVVAVGENSVAGMIASSLVREDE